MMKIPRKKMFSRALKRTAFGDNDSRLRICLVLSALLVLTSLNLSAAAPLALRVDVVPTSISKDGTTTTVEVQLAPPDRGRIGRQARMRVKLIQGSKIRAHILQDIDFDSQGLATAEYTWAPGRYELSLEIESLQGTAKGLWIGQIEIPASLDDVPRPAIPLIESTVSANADSPDLGGPTDNDGEATGVAPDAPDAPPERQSAPLSPADQETVDPIPAKEASPGPSAAVVQEPTPQPVNDVLPPPPRPNPSTSEPVFALVIDIDPVDDSTADRALAVRDEIQNRSTGVTAIVMQSDDRGPAGAIDQAIEDLHPFSDPRAIVVITDGRTKASRSDWKRTASKAARDGIPIIVIGIWSKTFDPGTRKQLSRLATESGGSSYLLQPSESPSRALTNVDAALAESR